MLLLVCCFCDQVDDKSTDISALHRHVGPRPPMRLDRVVSYTCCQACLQDDPGAVTFRMRQKRPNTSVPPGTVRARRSVAA
jgi:hypothetical protein